MWQMELRKDGAAKKDGKQGFNSNPNSTLKCF